MPKPTIVLVHGAWADGASWNAVSTELQSQGFTVFTPLPTDSTVPTASWPRIRPSVTNGTSPLRI